MRVSLIVSTVLWVLLSQPLAVFAGVRLFSGNLEVITTSGKACGGSKGNHTIYLVIGSAEEGDAIFGYVGSETVTVGQLRGLSPGIMALRYPYPDAERAEGHTMWIEINGTTLRGELHDRHLEPTVDDCNFDLARVKMLLVDNEEAASTAYQRLAKLYDAKLTRATALTISRTGAHAEATHVFERALALAEGLYPPGAAQLLPYLTGLANSYIRTAKYPDFISLYNSRFSTLQDEAVKQIFNHHQIRSLLQLGKTALGRADYQEALKYANQALLIDYKNKDAIAANMSALVRSGRHDEAIAFLEATEKKLDSDPDRRDVREAIALVEYQKAKKEQRAGRTAEAERSLRKAIKLDPGTAYYLVVLARWTHKAGKYSEADAILKRGFDSIKDEQQCQELTEARSKLRMTETILAKLRRSGV